jgi:hypothetical protein
MKKRKELPLFGILPFKIDLIGLKEEIQSLGLFEYSRYTDLDFASDTSIKPLIALNHDVRRFTMDRNSLDNIRSPNDLNSESYRQFNLTQKFDSIQTPKEFKIDLDHKISTRQRLKRFDPSSPIYDPLADERNYGQRKTGLGTRLNHLLDSLKGQVCRSRLAFLASGGEIQPHIDYDTDYIVRLHIPLSTNDQALMYISQKNRTFQSHLPADGSVFFFNAAYKHWVVNRGNQDRVHLVIDMHGQQDLAGMIEYPSTEVNLGEIEPS